MDDIEKRARELLRDAGEESPGCALVDGDAAIRAIVAALYAAPPAAQAVDLLEVNELLRIWQTHFDSGVRPDDDEPEDVALWDRIAAVRIAIDQQAGGAK